MQRSNYLKQQDNFKRGAFGELLVVEERPVIQLSFQYGVANTRLYDTQLSGGTLTHSDNMARLQTTATAGRYAYLLSDKRASYRNGQGLRALFTCLFSSPIIGTTQWIGLGTVVNGVIQNGFFIGYSAAGTFSVMRVRATVQTITAVSAFNGDYVDFVSENPPTKISVWTIDMQYLGAGVVRFGVEIADGTIKYFHSIQYSGTATETTIQNPSMQLVMGVANGAIASNVSIRSASLCCMHQGIESLTTGSMWSYQNVVASTAAAHILSIQNLATVNSITNYNKIRLLLFDMSATDNSNTLTGVFYIGLSPTLGGTTTFTDISTDRSLCAYNTVGTLAGVPSTVAMAITVDSKSSKNIDLSQYNLDIHPGEHVSIYFVGSGAYSSVRASLTWCEF